MPKPFHLRKRGNPEAKLQREIVHKLRDLGWYVKVTHGNIYQKGLPDIFACHKSYGHRWIEVKIEDAYKLQDSQLETFAALSANGSGVWIVTKVSQIPEILENKGNWALYIKF